jgi:four helix bundle protein
MQHFTELKVWRRSHKLVLSVYKLTSSWPKHELFGLISQVHRAAVSVPSNIAEGAKRRSPRDYSHFLNISEASLAETEYLLLLARDLGYLTELQHKPVATEADEISRMLHALRAKVDQGATETVDR